MSRVIPVLVLCAFLLAGCAAHRAADPVAAEAFTLSACAVNGPESVLSCLSDAYARRDTVLLKQLFTPDFVFQAPDTSWNRAAQLKTTIGFFTAKNVRSVELVFDPGFAAVPGEQRGTWMIDEVGGKLSAAVINGYELEPKMRTNRVAHQRFLVRKEKSPEPHYAIYKWEQIGTRAVPERLPETGDAAPASR